MNSWADTNVYNPGSAIRLTAWLKLSATLTTRYCFIFSPHGREGGHHSRPPQLFFLEPLSLLPAQRAHFLGSTSTYSASITPSSFFFSSPAAPLGEPPAACGPAPSAGGVWLALYITSASLCDAVVRCSRA